MYIRQNGATTEVAHSQHEHEKKLTQETNTNLIFPINIIFFGRVIDNTPANL